MPNFAYIVKDAKGARVEGILKADTLDMAIDKLSKEGSTIISVKEKTVSLRSADAKFEVTKSAITEITERGGDSSES